MIELLNTLSVGYLLGVAVASQILLLGVAFIIGCIVNAYYAEKKFNNAINSFLESTKEMEDFYKTKVEEAKNANTSRKPRRAKTNSNGKR